MTTTEQKIHAEIKTTKGNRTTKRIYEVTEELGVTPMLQKELGMTAQFVIKGARGATRLLQYFGNHNGRTIDTIGQTEYFQVRFF